MKASIVRTEFAAALLALCMMTGCGLAETGAAAAANGETAAEQAKQAKEIQEKIEKDLEAVQKAAAEQRAAIDATN